MARPLRNVTVTLDEETARWARLEAARKDTSVSRLIGELLRERMLGEEEYDAAMTRYLAREPRLHRRPGERYPSRDELHERDDELPARKKQGRGAVSATIHPGTVFVDTNVLVYVRDLAEPEKQRRAAEWLAALWDSRRGRTGMQVLQEYYHVLTRKLDPPRERWEVREDVESFRSWRPTPVDAGTLDRAWSLEDGYGFSWWDSLIVAAALQAGCEVLLTEDLQDGQRIEGLTILNPFLHDPETVLSGG